MRTTILVSEAQVTYENPTIENTEDNEQYRKGYIEGLEQARKGKHKTENNNAR